MRICRHSLGLRIVAFALCGSLGLAQDRAKEPVLGPAVQIGTLPAAKPVSIRVAPQQLSLGGTIVVTATLAGDVNDDVQAASFTTTHVAQQPQLGAPVLLASLTTEDVPPAAVVDDPDAIVWHLQQAANHLATAGIRDDSAVIEAIRQRFEGEHRHRLSLARKRADLAALQREIDELDRRVRSQAEEHVVAVSIRFIQADADLARSLTTKHVPDDGVVHAFPSQTMESVVLQKVLRDAKPGTVDPITSPVMKVLSGRTAQLSTSAGAKSSNGTLSIEATPQILDDGHVKLAVQIDDLETEVSGGLSRKSMNHRTVCDLTATQTLLVPTAPIPADATKVTLIAISAEVAHPALEGKSVTPARVTPAEYRSSSN
jgi:hypothetical protein